MQHVTIELDLPADLEKLTLPEGVHQRLQHLLDLQDRGQTLTPEERKEAEGLVALAEMLSLLKLRAQRVAQEEHLPGSWRPGRGAGKTPAPLPGRVGNRETVSWGGAPLAPG